ALVVADRLAEELGLPVFLYGELTAGERHPARSRAQLRRGGVVALAQRMASGRGEQEGATTGLTPDFGPPRMHPTAGAALVAGRPPLVAFNLQLAPPATLDEARRIAGRSPGGRAGLRGMGVPRGGSVAPGSMNVERPFDLPLARVVEAVGSHAAIASAEL